MTMVFGLGTRLHVRMRTTFENGVLRNGQQLGSAVKSFIDPCFETSSPMTHVSLSGLQQYSHQYGLQEGRRFADIGSSPPPQNVLYSSSMAQQCNWTTYLLLQQQTRRF